LEGGGFVRSVGRFGGVVEGWVMAMMRGREKERQGWLLLLLLLEVLNSEDSSDEESRDAKKEKWCA